MADTTIVFPRPGVTLYAPGGVHGFGAAYRDIGVPLPTAHADLLRAAGGVESAEDRRQAAEKKTASADPAAAPARDPKPETETR